MLETGYSNLEHISLRKSCSFAIIEKYTSNTCPVAEERRVVGAIEWKGLCSRAIVMEPARTGIKVTLSYRSITRGLMA